MSLKNTRFDKFDKVGRSHCHPCNQLLVDIGCIRGSLTRLTRFLTRREPLFSRTADSRLFKISFLYIMKEMVHLSIIQPRTR